MAYSRHKSGACLAVIVTMAVVCTAWSQATASDPYTYNIIAVTNTAPGAVPTVTFSVTNTATGLPADLRADPAWTHPAPAGASRLFIHIGWDTTDYTNKDSNTNLVNPATGTPFAKGAAFPIPINALAANVVANGDGSYSATVPFLLPVPASAKGTGTVIMEGHPAGQDPVTLAWTVEVPIKSVYRSFGITDTTPVPRRQVVDVNKCMVCHRTDGTGVAPRLTLHGANRTEEPQVCVVCHNPDQTDVQRRIATDATNYPVKVGSNVYPEQGVDFKRLVHGIHASSAGFRQNPLVVIGFNHFVFDASKLIRFPASLRNCINCHIDNGTKGTFELPLGTNVLGSTMNTRSVLGGAIDADPTNDVKITPTAAVCSSCHDNREVISHMISTGGASFRTTQGAIDSGTVQERCVNCHGPGKEKSVRRVHISGDD